MSKAASTAPPPFTIEGRSMLVNAPFVHSGKQVAKIVVRDLRFLEFVAMCSGVEAEVYETKDKNTIDPQLLMAKHRRRAQTEAFFTDDTKVLVDDSFFYQMPRRIYTAMFDMMDNVESPGGQVISKGDGIDTPLLYRLGTPLTIISTGEAGQTTLQIRELEFLAKTGGDIERVVAANSDQTKVVALLEDCCTPVSPEATLLRLTSDMLQQLTSSDGLSIQSRVLPDFLG